MEMLKNISGAVKDEKIFLFMDGAGFHRNPEVKKLMVELNIEPVFNVGYSFQYNPCERLWAQYKIHFRKILLEKMLRDPGPKAYPMKEALFETLCDKSS
jgi:transposase